ncbi:hypothetical protein DFP96_12018 [Listeria rocourtiae]|uniref:Uncharacterized protein n=1 Tax=Listeria rocourtiae TaxID=647910 RepID=A0A4R6ZFB9_9LIST|nr:hypothetical protein DFP96_12018 [Listeria rocourtiae]
MTKKRKKFMELSYKKNMGLKTKKKLTIIADKLNLRR